MKPLVIIFFLFQLYACSSDKGNEKQGADGWIKGNEDEKFKAVEKHLRGFDMAMVETGYRYTELYWAGKDQNWEYANYQLDKIKTAIENGIERRPKRAQSAQGFLQHSIPAMQESIQKKDTIAFNKGFQLFQASCRSCHVAEKVPYIQSAIPETRLSPVKFTTE